jgi:hypothetical protein
MIAKPISIKGTGCKSGGCVRKAVELTSGDLPFVPESGLRVERSILTGRQKSAAGVLCAEQRVDREGSSPSGARMRSAVSKSGGNASLAGKSGRYGEA